jgi:hypothetical protein
MRPTPLFFQSIFAFSLLIGLPCGAQAVGVREAAVSLERQLSTDSRQSATQSFRLPLDGSSYVLSGEATLEPLDARSCRRTLELVHDKPFERRGLRITSLSRRSVQDGPCHHFADAMAAQAEASARNIAEQIGVAGAQPDLIPGERMLVAQAGPATTLREAEPVGEVVTLTVLEKALIRDEPSRHGEKLSRADAGTRLAARRIPGNSDWFVLDGGLRFISASLVDVTVPVSAAATPVIGPARPGSSRVHLKVTESAVLRNAPSFKGQRVASLAAGVERIARKVQGENGWFELLDSTSRYPLYIHESVVSAIRADGKRL